MAEVLVVDDDTSIRETLRVLMEDAGHTVIEAHSGIEALEQMRAARGHLLVLLDLVMPAMDGGTVLQAVKNDATLRDRHAYIVLTAGNESLLATLSPYLDSLPVQLIRKPFDIDDLLAATDRALTQLAHLVGAHPRAVAN